MCRKYVERNLYILCKVIENLMDLSAFFNKIFLKKLNFLLKKKKKKNPKQKRIPLINMTVCY